jgi:hypothetical protein
MVILLAVPIVVLVALFARSRGFERSYKWFGVLALAIASGGAVAGLAATTSIYGPLPPGTAPAPAGFFETMFVLCGLGMLLGAGSVCGLIVYLSKQTTQQPIVSEKSWSPPPASTPPVPEAERDLVAEWRNARQGLDRPRD